MPRDEGHEALFFLGMGRARPGLEAALLDFLSTRGFGPEDEIAVAYSGGPDSTALLAALAALGWARPTAIYVQHGLREEPELRSELDLVAKACARLGARLVVARLRPGAIRERASHTGEGVEAEARRYRYAALRRVAGRRGARAVLIGHTADDQIETVLMRVLGGAGAGGVKGIPEASGIFLRPFLGIRKTALTAYLEDRGLDYSIDTSNASSDYLRNRIRQKIVPVLDGNLPGWRRGLALAAEKAALDEAALSAAADAIRFEPASGGAAELRLPLEALLRSEKAVALRSIVSAAGGLLRRGRFPARAAAAALEALRRAASAGYRSAAYRGAGLELFRRDGWAILRRALDFPPRGGYFVLIDRPRHVRVGGLDVRASWEQGDANGISADAFRFPLVVRSRRPGDSIALKLGTKRLDALFGEWALPEKDRASVPVLEDRDGIVAVLGAGLGGVDRFRASPGGGAPLVGSTQRLVVIVKGA